MEDLLRLHLSILLVNELDFKDKVNKFKDKLKQKWNLEYSESEIKKELEFLQIENSVMQNENCQEIPDDYFEGY